MPESRADPTRAAQAAMRPVLPRRFYATAAAAAAEGGWAVLLDGRSALTPARNRLVVARRAVAERMAAEWAAQGETIDPAAMPLTRLVNSALDGAAGAMDEIRAEVARYAGADLVCYRAETPARLAALQAQAFDPVLAVAREALGARFLLARGVTHVAQPDEALAAVRRVLAGFDERVALAGLGAMTTLTGSALIALGVALGRLSDEAAWRAAHVDEDFQISQWGEDAEAAARRRARWREMEAAAFAATARE